MEAAKALYENINDYAMTAMYTNGLDLDEVSENYKRFSEETFIFDHLTGEFTSRALAKHWVTAKGRLTFWRYQLQQYRTLSDPEINRYIVERLKEAISGK